MNVSKTAISALQQLDEQLFQSIEEYVTSLELQRIEWAASIEKDLDEYEKTGILSISLKELKWEVPEVNKSDASELSSHSASSSSAKNNSIPAVQLEDSKPVRMTRQMQKSILLSAQLHHTNQPNVHVKMESLDEVADPVVVQTLKHVKAKDATVKNTRNKKSTKASIKIKSERLDEVLKNQDNRDSDVQIQGQTLETIVLEDSVPERELEQTRTTRARTKKLRKDLENDSAESQSNRTTRTKRNKKAITEPEQNDKKDNDNNLFEQSVATKSAIDNLKETTIEVDDFGIGNLNTENTSTPFVTNGSSANVNETQIISKPTLLSNAEMVITSLTQPTLKDIMIDDEDVVSDSPPRSKRQKTTKAAFSSYDRSPEKTKVASHEQPESNSKLPVSTFRQTSADNDLTKNTFQSKSKEISKLLGTPLRDSKLRQLQTSSASKFRSNMPTSLLTSNKAATSLKTFASKIEFREREARIKKKELDAVQKKEALMLAQIEEKRKKREEREMKVRLEKMAMEKDKLKQLEMAEMAKNKKLKQIEAQKEAKHTKLIEELAKKRAAAYERALEIKQQEEINNEMYIPPYLQCETPVLPTADCYDSDIPERDQNPTFSKWQTNREITQAQRCMCHVEPQAKMFFSSGTRMPDLLEIFPSIKPSKLKRTSSAIWNKTDMSTFENMLEEND